MSDIKVLTWVGSLRAASVNPQIAALAAATAPAGITVNVYQGLGAGLGELPLYNEDIDKPPTYPHRLARCAAPSLKPTRPWW
jgi:NAD(P)H-dependent FMN reductase